MTEILMMILTPQLRKIAIKKRASHASSIREPDLVFRELVDKQEQAEITMKQEETENIKLQIVNNIQTTTLQINHINDSDTDLSKKITEILNLYEKNPNFKDKLSLKKWCNYCRRYGHSIAGCRQKQQDNQNKPQKHREPNKSFHQYMKHQNLPNKNIHTDNSSEKPLQITPITLDSNQLIIQIIEHNHHSKEIHKISRKTDIVDPIVEILNIKRTIQNQVQTNPFFV